MPKIGEHAVVLGASMGGLLAARVLAEFYDAVTVVERDVLRNPAPVNGVVGNRSNLGRRDAVELNRNGACHDYS